MVSLADFEQVFVCSVAKKLLAKLFLLPVPLSSFTIVVVLIKVLDHHSFFLLQYVLRRIERETYYLLKALSQMFA